MRISDWRSDVCSSDLAPWIQVGGTVLAVAGIAATLYAQRDMGESWRIGVDPSETTTLVLRGVFGLVRNPIFTAMLIFAAGITLRSEERRVGKEGVSPCRFRGSPEH